MTIGSSIFLVVIGAILRYAVTWTVASVDLHTVGLILMIAGVAGLALSLTWVFLPRYQRSGRRARRPAPSERPYGTPYEPRDYDGRTYDPPETRVYDEPDDYDEPRDPRRRY